MPDPTLDPVLAAVAALRAPRVVLAVSGGRDSMALLEACARACPERVAAVATFDHGTGEAARQGARHSARRARTLGFPVAHGRAREGAATEAGWRAARWGFLRRVAVEHGAAVVTAHTRDDQLETLAMRVLRGSGARGLAGMRTDGPVLRPFLALSREQVAGWAARAGVRWVEDPSNASRRHLRNRVRLELLPALERVQPGFAAALLALGERAAAVRAETDAAAAALGEVRPDGSVVIAAGALVGYDAAALRVLWPALAARAGATLERRGTSRAAEFTMKARPGGTAPLAGGFEIVRLRDAYVVRRARPLPRPARARRLDGATSFGGWRFRRAPTLHPHDPWTAALPPEGEYVVRPWQPGDRMRAAGSVTARRVKRFLADARVPAPDRPGWPVVERAGEIVWIPGVRRSDAATDRPGRPAVWYVCERIDD